MLLLFIDHNCLTWERQICHQEIEDMPGRKVHWITYLSKQMCMLWPRCNMRIDEYLDEHWCNHNPKTCWVLSSVIWYDQTSQRPKRMMTFAILTNTDITCWPVLNDFWSLSFLGLVTIRVESCPNPALFLISCVRRSEYTNPMAVILVIHHGSAWTSTWCHPPQYECVMNIKAAFRHDAVK